MTRTLLAEQELAARFLAEVLPAVSARWLRIMRTRLTTTDGSILIAIARPLEEGCTFADYHPQPRTIAEMAAWAPHCAMRKSISGARHAHNGDTRSRI